jgi:hypothetical protein
MTDDRLELSLVFEQEAEGAGAGVAGVPARVGRDEMNLAEFPFALLADRAPEGLSTIKFEDSVEGKDGKLVRRVWTVTGGEEFGLPVATDEEVYVALMEVTKEQGFDQRSMYITRYDLIKRLGWPDKGDSYRRLKEALDRLLGVTIKAEKAFWDNAKQRYVDVGFHIIDDYALYDENPGRKRAGQQDALPLSSITWNQVIFRSFQAGNIKQLDTAFFFGLRSSVSRRLYRYLDKKRYDGKDSFRIGVKKLAFEKLGMSRTYYPSHIKQELKRAHDELVESGFLSTVEYVEAKGGGEEQAVYRFTRRKYLVTKELPTAEAGEELRAGLEQVGVTTAVARQLVGEFGDEARVQLQYLPYRAAQDPPAVLVEAIKGQWEPPASYLKARAEEERRQEAAQRHSEEAKRQAEQEALEELQRSALATVLHDLGDQEREKLLARAAARVADKSPAVAQRPQSRAFGAMRQEELAQLVAEERGEELKRVRTRLAREAKLDLNDDL